MLEPGDKAGLAINHTVSNHQDYLIKTSLFLGVIAKSY
jgi:hypothetical protein